MNDLQYNVNQQAAGALAADIKNARKLKKKSKKTYVNIKLSNAILMFKHVLIYFKM